MSQPFCRFCGRPIPKVTHSHEFAQGPTVLARGPSSWSTPHAETPRSLAEVRRLLNGRVVALRYWGEGEARHVAHATTWDGESFRDPYFCRDGCARGYGYFALENPGYETKAYADAVRQAAQAN